VWLRVARVFLLLGIVLLSLHATAATVPMLALPVAAAAPMATTLCGTPVPVWRRAAVAPATAHDAVAFGYADPLGLSATAGAGVVRAYDADPAQGAWHDMQDEGLIYVALATVPAAEAAGGGTRAVEETFQILDGVRRSKAAELAGNATIRAEILGSGGKVVEIPLDALRSPKGVIDATTSPGLSRWLNTLRQTMA